MQPSSVQHLLDVAARHHREGDLSGAEARYRQALACQADSIEAMINLGVVLAQCGKHAEAIEFFRAALLQKPELPEAYNNLAISMLAVGRVAESVTAARTALRIRP